MMSPLRNLVLISLACGIGGLVSGADARARSLRASLRRQSWSPGASFPFDAKKRGPAERAEMVEGLGLRRVAYDWRPQHVESFEQEIKEYQRHDIEFFAFWSWHPAVEPLIRKYQVRPQIWMMLAQPKGVDQQRRVANAAEALLPMVEKTRELGLKLGIYNHGGWSGQPQNMVAVCKYLQQHHRADHVGIVYNFHHGHEHASKFAIHLQEMMPHLLCVNLNGMAPEESVQGMSNKILSIGSGVHERTMIQELINQRYQGPIGILDHRHEMDAAESLQQNMNGLAKIIDEIE